MTVLVLSVWGLGGFAVHPLQQARLVTLAPGLASASVALNLSATYLSQVLGAVIGGGLISGPGTGALSWAGLGLLSAACGSAFMASKVSKMRRAQEARHSGHAATDASG
jgi:predicted MFS family arabinose efflux permease